MATDNTSRCCPDPSFEAVADFSLQLNSAVPFMERHGLVPVVRNPLPHMSPDTLRPHSIPLSPPLPLPPLQQRFIGTPPPDRGVNEAWPFPNAAEE